jgi:hypothetical protein
MPTQVPTDAVAAEAQEEAGEPCCERERRIARAKQPESDELQRRRRRRRAQASVSAIRTTTGGGGAT